MKVAKLPGGEPELFYTLQGEGLHTGRPSVFLRLSLCNLHCHWCDTPYTWNWEGTPWEHQSAPKFEKEKEILTLSVPEICDQLQGFPCDNLVLTGGEPLLQQKELALLIAALPANWSIEIETNGTLLPEALFDFPEIQYNVSPKLPGSGNRPELALRQECLEWFSRYPGAYFKFVVTSAPDLTFIKELTTKYEIPKSRVILMPQGTDSESLREGALSLAEFCLTEGYRFSDRLHVHLWGNTRAK